MSLNKDQLTAWLINIRSGNLFCPFPNCIDIFYTSFGLAEHVGDHCKFGRYEEAIPCTHCSLEFKAKELKVHWRKFHKNLVTTLKSLKMGRQTKCPNYTCTEIFSGTFSGCRQYAKHSITCPPLYFCSNCEKEYVSSVTLKVHKCKATDGVDGKIANTRTSDARIERIISMRPVLSEKEEEDFVKNWEKKLAEGYLACPVPSCDKRFYLPRSFVAHLIKESKVDKIVKFLDVIACPYCNAEMNWDFFERHMQNNHRPMNTYLKSLSSKYSPCPNYRCKQKFKATTGIDYLKHSIQCRPLFCCPLCKTVKSKNDAYIEKHKLTCSSNSFIMNAVIKNNSKMYEQNNLPDTESMNASKRTSDALIERIISMRPVLSEKEEKDILKNWKKMLAKGYLTCPVPSCDKCFHLPNIFVRHLKKESKVDEIFKFLDVIACPYCNVEMDWNMFERHMQNNHRPITTYLKSLSSEDNPCPNYLCKQKFNAATGVDYLKHSIQCRPLYCCPLCKTVISKNDAYIEKHKLICSPNSAVVIMDDCPDLKIYEQNNLPDTTSTSERNSNNRLKKGTVFSSSNIRLSSLHTSKSTSRRKRKNSSSESEVDKVESKVRYSKRLYQGLSNVNSDSKDFSNSNKAKQEQKSISAIPNAENLCKITRYKTRSKDKTPIPKVNNDVDKLTISKILEDHRNKKIETHIESSVDFSTTDASGIDSLMGSDGILTPIVIPSDQILSSSFKPLYVKENMVKKQIMVKKKVQEAMAPSKDTNISPIVILSDFSTSLSNVDGIPSNQLSFSDYAILP